MPPALSNTYFRREAVMPARTYFIRLLLACAQSFDELLIGRKRWADRTF